MAKLAMKFEGKLDEIVPIDATEIQVETYADIYALLATIHQFVYLEKRKTHSSAEYKLEEYMSNAKALAHELGR